MEEPRNYGEKGPKGMLEIVVPIVAVPKGRPRAGRSGVFYTPPRTSKYEKALKAHFKEHMKGRTKFLCPVRMTIFITKAIPKSYNRYMRQCAAERHIRPARGDLDNYVKAITDAANGVLYVDDVQISSLTAEIRYGEYDNIYIAVETNGLTPGEVEQYITQLKNV